MHVYKMEMKEAFVQTVLIEASAAHVWRVLTDVSLIKQWMSEEEVDVETTWQVGSPIVVKGTNHWVYFENTGTVLAFEPDKCLQYTHLSSLSKLPHVKESFTGITFDLSHSGKQTLLKVSLSNFPTESIYKHWAFYWPVTLQLIKQLAEKL